LHRTSVDGFLYFAFRFTVRIIDFRLTGAIETENTGATGNAESAADAGFLIHEGGFCHGESLSLRRYFLFGL
jgi:hypothetical protein